MADRVQHGIDDDPNNDAEKGATIGGLGGAAVGAAAGAMAGPVGAVVGAVVGGLGGAGASGLAVGAVDKHDNDNTVTGLGGNTRDPNASTLSGNDVVGMAEPRRTDMADSGQNAVYGTAGTTVTHTSDVSDMNIDRGAANTPNVRSDANLTTGTGATLDAGALASGSATNVGSTGAGALGVTTPMPTSASYGTTSPDAGIGGMNNPAMGNTGGLTGAHSSTVTTTTSTSGADLSPGGASTNVPVNTMTSHPDTLHSGGTVSGAMSSGTDRIDDATDNVGGHNIVTGDEAKTGAGKAGLGGGAVVGGLIGTAVGGPVGAVVGGALGSLAGGVAGDAAEADDDDINRTGGNR